MKKSLIAMAVLAGFAGAVAAQSTVTLSGSVDAGLRRVDGVTTMAGAGSSRNNLTFSGVEDLGGGNSAFFTLNHRFNIQNGTQNGQNSTPAAATATSTGNTTTGQNIDAASQFYRQLWVGLKNNSVGDLRLGRFLYPVQELNGTFDVFGTDTVGTTHTGGLKANLRTNSSGYLRSASFGGFQIHAAYGRKDGGGTQGNVVAGGVSPSTNGTLTAGYTVAPAGLAGNFATGPLSVALAWDRAGADLKTTAAYGSYDFGVAKLFAQYEKTDVNLVGGTDKRYSVSAGIPVGALSKVKIGYLSIDDSTKVGKQAKLGLGYDLGLSKRTTIYTDMAKLSGDEASVNNKKTRFDIGINHKF
jgi:predicted porin